MARQLWRANHLLLHLKISLKMILVKEYRVPSFSSRYSYSIVSFVIAPILLALKKHCACSLEIKYIVSANTVKYCYLAKSEHKQKTLLKSKENPISVIEYQKLDEEQAKIVLEQTALDGKHLTDVEHATCLEHEIRTEENYSDNDTSSDCKDNLDSASLTKDQKHLQTILHCSDSDIKTMYKNLPRMKHNFIYQRVLKNVNFLQKCGYSQDYVNYFLKRHGSYLVQCDSTIFEQILKLENTNKIKSKYAEKGQFPPYMLCKLIEYRVFGVIDCLEFSSRMLGTDKETLVRYCGKNITVFSKRNIVHLKEKFDYLISEGFSTNDILQHFYVLRYPFDQIEEALHIVKQFGDVQLSLLLGLLIHKIPKDYKPKSSMFFAELLKCRKDLLSKRQIKYLRSINIREACYVIQLLKENGFTEDDIRSSYTILGQKPSDVKDCLRKVDISTSNHLDKQKVLNLILYELECNNPNKTN